MDLWTTFEHNLIRRLRPLAEDEFFIVEGPPRLQERPAGFFGRRTRTEQAGLFAQLLEQGGQ